MPRGALDNRTSAATHYFGTERPKASSISIRRDSATRASWRLLSLLRSALALSTFLIFLATRCCGEAAQKALSICTPQPSATVQPVAHGVKSRSATAEAEVQAFTTP